MGLFKALLLGLVIASVALSFIPSYGADYSIFFTTRASASSIIINEVMFDPIETELSGEWVELHNPTDISIDVTGWALSDQESSVDFIFPTMLFPAGGYALVHVCAGQNSTEFINGTAEFFMGKSSTLLSNTGDDVLLSDSGGSTVDFMSYGQWDGGSVEPPPPDFNYTHSNATAQEGFSLARVGNDFVASVPTPLYPNGDGSVPGLLLIAVHYYAWGDNEFVTLHNPLACDIDISSWYITDLEGKIAFPLGTVIPSGGNLTVAQNASNYLIQTLALPDFEYTDTHPSVREMENIGSVPALANSGDELFLLNNFGSHVDAFCYGDSSYAGPGWDSNPMQNLPQGRVAKRYLADGYTDTNSSADWENIRQYVIGQSDFHDAVFPTAGALTVFASPDSSFQTISGAIDNATESIWLTLYEFTSYPLAERILRAMGRGVEVRLFLEGSPVEGISPNELFIARKIVEAGGQVRIMTSDTDEGIYARYSYVHAKYAVIDSDSLLIMSENWGLSGIPLPGTAGNRGWGAFISDPGIAGYFSEVFLEDWNPERSDSVAFDAYHPLWGAGVNSTFTTSQFNVAYPPMAISSQSKIIPVLAPDTSLSQGTILGTLDSADERVLVQEFYIYKHWGDRVSGSVETTPNLYLESVIDAARRGCQVRILLDSIYYNVMEDDPIDNDDTVAYVNGIAAAEGLDMQAKLVDLDEHGFDKIHNKGLIADDSVLISSINWNLNSATRNRESGVIIQNKEAADYFSKIFFFDWIDDLTPPFAHFRAADAYQVGTAVQLNASTSSDNVGITNYTWHLDGEPVCHSLHFVHQFESVGSYDVNLTVRDAWGNAASYHQTINITEDAPAEETGDGVSQDTADTSLNIMIAVLLMIPIFIFVAILLVARMRR